MGVKKNIVSGAIAVSLLFAGLPLQAFADVPPVFQHQGDNLNVTQIAQYDSGQGEGGTEIMAYDVERQLAFVTNGAIGGFDILSFSNLESGNFTKVDSKKRILLSEFGINEIDDITSIASHPTKDLIAISAVSDPKTDPGYIVFATKDGEYLTHVQVGSLPDMVTFTPDGTKALVANEGEPNDDYSIDPEGSISIIDLTGDVKDFQAKTITFEGVPLDENVRAESKGTILQQLEPEYITVSNDSNTAYVALQENNAIATVDLLAEKIVSVKGLGIKDHSAPGNELDAIKDGEIKLEKQPILAYYMPDAIDTYEVGGKTYILTPNEGDARDYDAYSEEADLIDILDKLDLKAEHYQGYSQEALDKLVQDGGIERIGDYKITIENGLNEEGKYEAIYGYGGRSFSIFDANTMELVYDSGSEFEKIIAEAMPEHFNITNDELGMDDRSDNKGPEPETVISGEIDGTTYAFVALERFSGIMVFDLSNPSNPEYVTLISSRDFSVDVGGDVSPEGLQFIRAEDSPTGNALLAATHEISGTVAVYEFNGKPFVDFQDIHGHWAEEAIVELASDGIIKGRSNTVFAPNENITRGEFTSLLVRALGLNEDGVVNGEIGFKDVPSDHIYAGDIQAAVEAGFVHGFNDGTFRSKTQINREQMAAIISRAYNGILGFEQNLDVEKVLASYKDKNKISNWALQDVANAVNSGIIHGVSANELNLSKKATRAEGAMMLRNFIEQENKIDFHLSVMHTNDTHASLDNVAKRVTAVKDYRSENPHALLLDAGDVFTGTLYFNEFQGMADLEFMNLMGYDAMTFGNHEFDLGSSETGHQGLVDFIKAAEFPFVSSNVNFDQDGKFTDIFSDVISSEPENGNIYSGIIKEVNGEKVGIFGLTTSETADISSPGAITFDNYLAEAEKSVKAFEDLGVDKIIAITHIGYDDDAAVDNDLTLAKKVDGIDIIVGGHSHTTLVEPAVNLVDENGKQKEPTLIVQTGNANSNLGTLEVAFDENGVIIAQKGELISVGDVAADPDAAKLLAPYAERIKEVSEQEIGVTVEAALENPRTDGDNTKPSVRKNETILGNLITDGMLSKAKEYNENVIMALQNGGGIRAEINAGPITVGEVITVLPYNNTLATMEVTGAELKEAFEISFRNYPGENGGFLHVAGGKVEFDSSKPAGQRVVSISYQNTDGNYTEINANETYVIATNAFTAKGGDGFDVFAKAYEEGRVKDLGLSDWENFAEHLTSLEVIPTEVEGRIVDVAK